MKTDRILHYSLQLLALALVGEGVVGLVHPTRYSRFWKIGPRPLRESIEALAQHRAVARGLFVVEIGLGLWLALREIEAEE